jgi:hypothetical protein
MPPDAIDHLARILQLSITPVAMISGVGLLLLSMTNRLGRVIDRARALGVQVETMAEAERVRSPEVVELRILFRRARMLQLAIALIATSIFCATIMVAGLFAMHLLGSDQQVVILSLFGLCLLALVASIVCFLGDIFLSIRWLKVSLGRYA